MKSFDNTQAWNEGWTLSDYHSDRGVHWQIQRLDDIDMCGLNSDGEPNYFEDDFKALAFVNDKADTGSEYHKIAAESDGVEVF